eukprot:scaffold21544_cov50-Phaeocystis_antarctica.AAC.1
MGARRQRLTPSGVVIQSVKDAGSRRRRRAGRGVVTTSQQESLQATRLPPPKSTLTYIYWGAVSDNTVTMYRGGGITEARCYAACRSHATHPTARACRPALPVACWPPHSL